MSITIKDVAREAQVSVTTVSDVLNGRDRVAKATVHQVQTVMRQLGYQPRSDKRREVNSGSQRKSRLYEQDHRIVILVQDNDPAALKTKMMTSFQSLCYSYLREMGHDLMVTCLKPDGSLPKNVTAKKTKGVIFRGDNLELVSKIRAEGQSIVTIFNSMDGCDGIAVNDDRLAQMACEYFSNQKAKEVFVVVPNATNVLTLKRVHPFVWYTESVGIQVNLISMDDYLEKITSGSEAYFFIPWIRKQISEEKLLEIDRNISEGRTLICSDVKTCIPTIYISMEKMGCLASEQICWRIAHADRQVRTVLLEPDLLLGGEVVNQ